jgi:hypothetical protein
MARNTRPGYAAVNAEMAAARYIRIGLTGIQGSAATK